MKKYLLILLGFALFLNASWIKEYQLGMYIKDDNKIYALVQQKISNDKYKKAALNEALADISTQLFSEVVSVQFLDKRLLKDEFTQNFKQKIFIISDLPIHGATKENELIEDGTYYLLLSFDKKDTASIYKIRANELAKELDTIFEDYKKQTRIGVKENILNSLHSKMENYEKYSLVSKLLKQTNILKPKITPYFIKNELSQLYDVTTKDIEGLSKVLANIIKKTEIKSSIRVMAFSYEDKDTYSSFSSEFKNNLEKELNKTMYLTTRNTSKYKLLGNYFLKEDHLIVKAALYDEFGDIELIAMAKMKMNPKNKNYYIPKINDYDTLNETVLDENLNVQTRMNKMTKNLLFTKGVDVNIEVKVSKEAYIYIIGNMRTSAGQQIQYLLPLNEKINKERFQKHIPYQNSNLWVGIGAFEIYPPFGVEVLQVFATNIDILDELPNTQTQKIDGEEYEVIVDEKQKHVSAKRSISKMRGLKKKSANKELQKAEAILKFTTLEK